MDVRSLYGGFIVFCVIFCTVAAIEECKLEKDPGYKCPDFRTGCKTHFHNNCSTIPCDGVQTCDPERFDSPFCCNNYCGGCMAVVYCNGKIVNCFQEEIIN
ncbi:uncharacterized protein LOC134695213 [Mytilus trossulus]|uniref:uncharacterized protein LOC134695213 n=1 Tax=Mytilus trossulus TaxID=6551 RepID=UPI003006717E